MSLLLVQVLIDKLGPLPPVTRDFPDACARLFDRIARSLTAAAFRSLDDLVGSVGAYSDI